MPKGPAWKPVNVEDLSESCRALHEDYILDFRDTIVSSGKLKEAVYREWAAKFPNGVDAKERVFHTIGGVLLYVDKAKKPHKGRPCKEAAPRKIINLMEALRRSAKKAEQ